MKIIKEFKEFALKGNVLDMAVGVIIGGAFGKIVTSLVGDIIMPLFGCLTPTKFTDLQAVIGDNTENPIMYGNFIQNIVDFLIIAISIFLVVKAINTAKAKFEKEEEAEEEEAKPTTEDLLGEIRDLLKEKQ